MVRTHAYEIGKADEHDSGEVLEKFSDIVEKV
jgi:hypothetical protein